MSTKPHFQGFDGLMSLSRREGVDIRPTLLRVLTDLYVQANTHTTEEDRQFVELASRLIDQVDDATRAAVRARLAIYPSTPREILGKLGLLPEESVAAAPARPATQSRALIEPHGSPAPTIRMQPGDAAEIHELFFRAGTRERLAILQSLTESPLRAAPRIAPARALHAVEALEMAAFVGDFDTFVQEIDDCLVLPARMARQVVSDPGGEPLALAARMINMPPYVFQRVLLFLRPDIGNSVDTVYRLSRLYDRLGERAALIMLAAWRGASMVAARPKHRPVLYDDDRQRVARANATQPRGAVQPVSDATTRTGTDGFRR